MEKILIIGNGSQSKRIQRILKKIKKKFLILDYKSKNESYLKKLYNSDVIFICSPNKSHFKYIMHFIKKRKYIFCEKPPVNKMKELKTLAKTKYKKIYFNYNYRFSKLGEIFFKIKKFKLGNLLSGSVFSTHGLATKKSYISSWRSNKKKCPRGIFEIVTIHTIDILNYYFDIKKIKQVFLKNISKIGNSYDTSEVRIEMKNSAQINIFNSYYSPYYIKWNLIFENGIIELSDNTIEIRGPRNTFDKNKNFIFPKIIKKFKISHKNDYENSLKKSIEFFFKHVKNKKNFDKKFFNRSIKSNKFILERL